MSTDETNQTQVTKHRFLTIGQAAEELNVKESLVRGLIKTGELRALQIGGRGYLGRLSRWCSGSVTG